MRRRADPLVTDDAFNTVAEMKEGVDHSRRNSRHCLSGSGDGYGQNYLKMVGNTYLAPPIFNSGDWPRVARNSSDDPSNFFTTRGVVTIITMRHKPSLERQPLQGNFPKVWHRIRQISAKLDKPPGSPHTHTHTQRLVT